MELIAQLKKRLQEKLPAEKAHSAVMSYNRKTASEIKAEKTAVKESAVLCLLVPSVNDYFVYLMERNVYGGVHSGQISLPGGKTEPSDLNFMYTALRETEEELGISPDKIEILGELSTIYIPPSNFLVYPFVGIVKEEPVLSPSPYEVQQVLKASLNQLNKSDAISESPVQMSGSDLKIKVKHFTVDGHVVWGATAMILSELIYLIKEINS